MVAPTLEERTSRLEGSYDHLATKADVERVRVEVERVRVDMERNRAEARADTERLRADIARRLRWLGIAVISAMGVIAGVAVAFIKLAC